MLQTSAKRYGKQARSARRSARHSGPGLDQPVSPLNCVSVVAARVAPPDERRPIVSVLVWLGATKVRQQEVFDESEHAANFGLTELSPLGVKCSVS